MDWEHHSLAAPIGRGPAELDAGSTPEKGLQAFATSANLTEHREPTMPTEPRALKSALSSNLENRMAHARLRYRRERNRMPEDVRDYERAAQDWWLGLDEDERERWRAEKRFRLFGVGGAYRAARTSNHRSSP